MGMDTLIAINLWSCYLSMLILITLSSKPSLETWLGLAKILNGQQTNMTYLHQGDIAVLLEVYFPNTRVKSWALVVKLLSDELHKKSFVISQYWFR